LTSHHPTNVSLITEFATESQRCCVFIAVPLALSGAHYAFIEVHFAFRILHFVYSNQFAFSLDKNASTEDASGWTANK